MAVSPVLTGKFINDETDIPASGGNHHTITAVRYDATTQTLTLTVRDAGPDVAVGNLKYQITNGAAITDIAGNALGTQTRTMSIDDTAIDTTKPILTSTRVGTSSTATYIVTATDTSPVTGKTKDNVILTNCTDTTTTDNTWTYYTSGEYTGTADNTNGRCVIITDAAGNKKAQHLSDSDNTVTSVPILTLDLTSDTGDTTDDHTSDTTPEFTVTGSTAYGGSANNEVRLYHKNTACGTLPTDITTIAGLTDWTLYKTTATSATSSTTTTGITSQTALTTTDDHCFLAIYSTDGSAITRYGQLDVVIDITAPTVIPHISPSLPSGTPTKFSRAGDVAVQLDSGDEFGSAVSLSADGTLMAVGASHDDGTDSNRGAVYLFQKTNGSWAKTLKISDNDGSEGLLDINLSNGDNFGSAVSLSADGTILAVGADGDDDGAVYLFQKTNGSWAKTLKISDNGGGEGLLDIDLSAGIFDNNFGSAVSLSADGTALAVGADGDNNNDGAVYLFQKSGNTWAKTLKISHTGDVAVPLDDWDFFGSAVSLSADGTTLAVGASRDDDGNNSSINANRGAVYLFQKSGNTWAKTLKISDNGGGTELLDINLSDSDSFGSAVSFSGDGTTLAVGVDGDNEGAVYLFQKTNGSWAKTLKISDNGGGEGLLDIDLSNYDNFGTAVSLSVDGTLVAVGADGDYEGAVYTFDVSPTSTTSATVTAVDTEDSSTMKYKKVSGTACTATQFTGDTGTPYTEGDAITVTSETDNNKRFCFRSEDGAGNIGYGISITPNIDTTAPTLTPTKVGIGNAATYKVSATDVSPPLTGRTKDNVALVDCTDSAVTTTSAGWSDYTPGTDTGTADDTNGRCVIITDAVGNSKAQHLSDSDNTITGVPALTLDLTSDTGDTTDDHTSDTTPEFTVTGSTAYGGSANNEVRLYHKNTACGILPTAITTIAGLTDWTLYKTTDVSAASSTTTTGITSGTALTTTDEHCFLAVYSTDGSAITRHGQIDVVIDTTTPTVIPHIIPSLPSGTPTKFSHTSDVAVTLDDDDRFGSAVAFSADGTLMAVGAYGDDDGGTDNNSNRGAVYLFQKTNSSWAKTLKISDNNNGSGLLDIDLDNSDRFGTTTSLSADGTMLAVGAYGDDDGGTNRGAIYLFQKTGNTWAKTLKISDNAGGSGLLDINLSDYDRFGRAVSLSADGTMLVAGSYGDDDGGTTSDRNRGAVYLFQKTGDTWAKTLKISDNGGGEGLLDINLDNNDRFGVAASLSADGTMLAVGAYYDDDGHASVDRGAVYLFQKTNGTWTKTLKISDNDDSEGLLDINLDNNDEFGNAISFSADGTMLAVGAHDDDDGGQHNNRGAVYLFQKTGGTWAKTLKISDNDGGKELLDINLRNHDFFGSAVSFSGDGTMLAVGADHNDDGSSNSYERGAVYAFSVSPKLTASATVTAVDTEDSSTMKYMKTTGTSCTSAQFAGGTGTPYTEGDEITVATEADNNKRFCFKSEDGAGNSSYGISAVLNIDTTAPVLTPIRTGTGSTATYIVTATDVSPPLTGKTRDNIASGSCTDTLYTFLTSYFWSDYTPGTNVGTADDTNGRCVIITDAAGNSKAQHLSDSDNTIESDFTLDITGNDTANYLDAIVHYYYAQNPSDESAGGAVMANFINANDSPAKTGTPITTATIYTTMQDSATTRDFTGNGTANYLDAIVHYYYAQNPLDQSAGGAVMANFINANDSPAKTGVPTTTEAIYTLLQGLGGRSGDSSIESRFPHPPLSRTFRMAVTKNSMSLPLPRMMQVMSISVRLPSHSPVHTVSSAR